MLLSIIRQQAAFKRGQVQQGSFEGILITSYSLLIDRGLGKDSRIFEAISISIGLCKGKVIEVVGQYSFQTSKALSKFLRSWDRLL